MTTSPSHEPTEGAIPPGAFERVTRERDQFKTQAEQARQVAEAALLVDKVYGHLTTRQYAETEARPKDPYGTAKFIASHLPLGTSDPAAEVDRWLTQASALLTLPGQVPAAAQAAPQATTQTSPAPGGGSGPNPGAAGLDVTGGPFPMNGKEFKDFVAKHGMDAVGPAVAQGLFYFSDENKAAQATARGL